MITANTIHNTDTEDDPFALDFDFSSIQDDLNFSLDGQIPVSMPMEPQFVTPNPASVLSGEMEGMEEKTEEKRENMIEKAKEAEDGE
jgi:hypothetical protein